MADDQLYHFVWPVDQHGYEFTPKPPGPAATLSPLRITQTPLNYKEPTEYMEGLIQPKGGPIRNYWPLEDHPGLWLQFATDVTDETSAVAFANKFGLVRGQGGFISLLGMGDPLGAFLDDADQIRQISDALYSKNDKRGAIDLFNQFGRYAKLFPLLGNDDRKGTIEFRMVPQDLSSAMFLQAGEAIAGNLVFRRCRQCTTHFRLGTAQHTTRREFCSDRCRVAWARHNKKGAVQ